MRILLVEDNEDDAVIVGEVLAGVAGADLTWVDRLSLAAERLRTDPIDLVLLDLALPDSFGVATVQRLRAHAPDIPIVVLTSSTNDAAGLEAVKCGAQDFVPKGELTASLLERAMRYAIERHRAQAALREASMIDALTGLHNRRGFFALAEQYLKSVRRRGAAEGVLLYLDLDGLKEVNDTRGHAAGDVMLCTAASVLRETFRESDILARLGGDEFVVLAASEQSTGPEIVERLKKSLAARNVDRGEHPMLSMSIGAIPCPSDRPLEAAIIDADRQMYAAKRRRMGE